MYMYVCIHHIYTLCIMYKYQNICIKNQGFYLSKCRTSVSFKSSRTQSLYKIWINKCINKCLGFLNISIYDIYIIYIYIYIHIYIYIYIYLLYQKPEIGRF